MGKANRYTVDEIIDVYKRTGFNVTETCEAFNITRTSFYRWLDTKKGLSEAKKNADESVKDFAESKLQEKIRDGDVQCLIFFLKTKCKDRGYVEKVENDIKIDRFEELMKSVEDEED